MFHTIGIFAHIDAGKTTLTENLLEYLGWIPKAGSVEEGTTESDSHPEEIKRGISIFSNVFPNPEYNLCLIDTPGHIDFSLHSESMIPHMDMAILILDASRGFESRTDAIYTKLLNSNIPVLVFINKIDRYHDVYLKCIQAIEGKLQKKSFLLSHDYREVVEDSYNIDQILLSEQNFLEDFLDLEKVDLDHYSNNKDYKFIILKNTFYENFFRNKFHILFWGSAKKKINTKSFFEFITTTFQGSEWNSKAEGFEFIMKYIIFEMDHLKGALVRSNYKSKKTLEDFHCFTRTKRGWVRKESIDPGEIFFVSVDDFDRFGWKDATSSEAGPFQVQLEVESEIDFPSLELALKDLVWSEDGCKMSRNPLSLGFTIWGRGELHLELILSRLETQLGKKVPTGNIRVDRFEHYQNLTKQVVFEHFSGVEGHSSGVITVLISSLLSLENQIEFDVNFPEDLRPILRDCFFESLALGPLGHEVFGVHIKFLQWDKPIQEFREHLIKVALLSGIRSYLNENTRLVGPRSNWEIQSSSEYVGGILQELLRRKAKVTTHTEDDSGVFLRGTASAENMLGFSKVLRNLTKGTSFWNQEVVCQGVNFETIAHWDSR